MHPFFRRPQEPRFLASFPHLATAFLALTMGTPLRADIASTTVKVEFMDGQTKVTPGDPTINLAASPSVVLELLPGDAKFDVTPVLATTTLARAAEKWRRELAPLKVDELDDLLAALQTDPNKTNLKRVLSALESAPTRAPKASEAEKKKLETAKEKLEKAGESTNQSATRFLLNFHRGWWWEYTRGHLSDIWDAHKVCDPPEDRNAPADVKKDEKKKESGCHHVDFVEPLPNAGWDIYLTNRTYASDFPIVITCKGDKCKKGGSSSRLLVIHLDTASWAIASSAGLMFPYLRDERFRVNDKDQLERLPDGVIPYFAATYLHYCPVNGVPILDAFCPTLAVGTQVPSDGILVGLGLGGRIKPIESFNAAYFNVGVAYGPHKTLNDTYLGMKGPISVPTGTNPDDVLKTRYGFKFFAGVSIGITDGIEKFRGVFPGSKGDSSKVEQAPGGNGNGKGDDSKGSDH